MVYKEDVTEHSLTNYFLWFGSPILFYILYSPAVFISLVKWLTCQLYKCGFESSYLSRNYKISFCIVFFLLWRQRNKQQIITHYELKTHRQNSEVRYISLFLARYSNIIYHTNFRHNRIGGVMVSGGSPRVR